MLFQMSSVKSQSVRVVTRGWGWRAGGDVVQGCIFVQVDIPGSPSRVERL